LLYPRCCPLIVVYPSPLVDCFAVVVTVAVAG
jgi:hypothetical protein